MTAPIQIHSRVGKDGVLNLQVPLGLSDADSEVLVTIQPLEASAATSTTDRQAWHAFVRETYGSCAGLGLERH